MAHDVSPPVDTLTLRRLALEAESDPRTVLRELRGERTRGIVGERIRRVLLAAGLPSSDTRSEAA